MKEGFSQGNLVDSLLSHGATIQALATISVAILGTQDDPHQVVGVG